MALTEKQIEDLIYDSPWILDERFLIPEIKGENGVNGRQINVGRKQSRKVDLLFKDTRDNRPIIVELKKGSLRRTDIGQILEYKSLLISLEYADKKKWSNEFGQNYYCPKMILIGSDASEDIVLSANIAGIEIRTFKSEHISELGFTSFKELRAKMKEWDNFRNKGNRTLADRKEWLNQVLSRTQKAISGIDNITTLERLPEFSSIKNYYANKHSPFIDIPIFYKGDFICGFYEYFDAQLIFDDQFVYFDYSFVSDEVLSEEEYERCKSDVTKYLSEKGIEYLLYGEEQVPVIKIKRPVLEADKLLSDFLKPLINFGIKLYNKYMSHANND